MNNDHTSKGILVLTREYYPIIGGGGRATRILTEEWARQGYMVHVLTARVGAVPSDEMVNGVRVFRVWSWSDSDLMTLWGAIGYTVMAFFKGLALYRQYHYRAIHSGFLVPAGFVGVLLGWICGIPHETMPMGGDVYEPAKKLSPHRNAIFRAIVRWVVNHSLVATSSSDLETKIKQYYSSTAKQIRIPVGFLEPQGISVDRSAPLPGAPRTIVAIGVLLARKNYDKIIEALAYLNRPNVRLCIVGEGPMRHELEQLAKDRGVADRVFMPGALSEEEKYKQLLNADIFCSMADHDGYSIVCQEGMYFRLPIVAANTGGQIDYLNHEQNSLLVSPRDTVGMAAAFARFLDDPAYARRMADQAKRDWEQFRSDRIARQHLEVMGLV